MSNNQGDANAPLSLSSKCIETLTRKEQKTRFGIDCGDAIIFGGGTWAPGGEHVRKMTVKNVSTQTIKFKVELPTTRYFSMEFPELITLSPGTHVIVNVAFRPVEYASYDDSVLFHVFTYSQGHKVSGGTFRVAVQAHIAILKCVVPDDIDFEFCPTAEITTQLFTLENTGQIDATFMWDLPDTADHEQPPFALQPSSGEICAGENIKITARFSPTSATSFVTPARCYIQVCIYKMSMLFILNFV